LVGAALMGNDAIPFARPVMPKSVEEEILKLVADGWWTSGPRVRQLELEFPGTRGAPAVACSSATAGLFALFQALGVDEEWEVHFSTWTFSSMPMCARLLGARVVLLDVDPHTLMPRPTDWMKAAEERLFRRRASVLTHFGGFAQPGAARLGEALGATGPVVDDAAHVPLLWANQDSGGYMVTSFYPTKNLPGMEGGVVLSKNEWVREWVASFVSHGFSHAAWDRYTAPGAALHYDVVQPGFKANMTEITAALVLGALAEYRYAHDSRRLLFSQYRRLLPSGVRLLEPEWYEWTDPHMAVVFLPEGVDRDAVAELMAKRGVRTSVHFKPVHQHTFWAGQMKSGRAASLPFGGEVADACFKRVLSLPLHLALPKDGVQRVCDVLAGALRELYGG
jgi:dTDP-4-amino-4,6-dideoxygalactose transaminase